MRALLQRLRHSTAGVAVVEFAMMAPVLLLLVIGALEIGYKVYAISTANGALREAARMASTGKYTGTQIDDKVKGMIRAWRADADISIIKKSYSDFTGVGLPEPITSGSVASGSYCYEDTNGNSKWDEDRGAEGLGDAEDVIYYEVTVKYPTLFAFSQKTMGFTGEGQVKLNTIVSNEPYAPVTNAPPANRCV